MAQAIQWTEELIDRAMHLRVNQDLGWSAIQRIMGFPTSDAPRIKINRELASGRNPPHPSEFADWDYEQESAMNELIDRSRQPADASSKLTKSEELAYEVASFEMHDYTFTGTEYQFAVNGQIIKVPAERWERIVQDYSTSGGNLTRNEIARRHGFPQKVLEACLRLYGHYKARPPVSREALETSDDAPLIAQAIEVREHRFAAKLETEQQSFYRAKAERLERELSDRLSLVSEARAMVRDAVQDMLEGLPAVEQRYYQGELTAVYHIPLFDPHLGQVTHGSLGWGQDYDTKAATNAVRTHGEASAAWIDQQGGASHVYYTLGGDFFHAMLGKTKKGTDLLRDVLTDRVVFREGLRAVIASINALRRVARHVTVLSVPGNHDHLFAEILEETLAVAFETADDVSVPNEEAKRKWFRVGNSLHIIDHGEAFTRFGDKAMVSAEMIARVVCGQAYHGVEKVYLYVGHTHHKEVKANGPHLELIRVQTFSPASEYAEGLVLFNDLEAPVYTLDTKGRLANERRLYFSDALTL